MQAQASFFFEFFIPVFSVVSECPCSQSARKLHNPLNKPAVYWLDSEWAVKSAENRERMSGADKISAVISCVEKRLAGAEKSVKNIS